MCTSHWGSTHGSVNLCERWQSEFKLSPVLCVLGNGVALKVHSLKVSSSSELVNITPVLQEVVVELGEGWGRVGGGVGGELGESWEVEDACNIQNILQWNLSIEDTAGT